MLPKNKRLTRKDIQHIMKVGKTISSPSFRVRYISDSDTFKVSPVVSKKIAKTAVQRNDLRRYIYTIVSEHKESFPNKQLLVFLQKNIEKEQINTELHALLQKLINI